MSQDPTGCGEDREVKYVDKDQQCHKTHHLSVGRIIVGSSVRRFVRARIESRRPSRRVYGACQSSPSRDFRETGERLLRVARGWQFGISEVSGSLTSSRENVPSSPSFQSSHLVTRKIVRVTRNVDPSDLEWRIVD